MTRIVITAAAYTAIVAGRDPNSLLPAQESPQGDFYLWLDQSDAEPPHGRPWPG